MGFNKRIISQNSIKLMTNTDYKTFFDYFKSDVIISDDTFSSKILKEIRKLSITDKEDIIKIMNKCK